MIPSVLPEVQAAPLPEIAPEETTGEVDPMQRMGLKQTSLELSETQLKKLVKRALTRRDELMDEMGLMEGGQCAAGSWMEKRQLNQAQYDNNWLFRLAMGGIFKFSNFSLNLSKRYTRLMAAKTADDLVGTEPFFASMPTKHGDPQLAKQAEWYVQEKVAASNTKSSLVDGTKIAFIRNEGVMKQGLANDSTYFFGSAEVAVGPFQYEGPDGVMLFGPGEPIITPKGAYVYRKDETIPDPTVEGLLRLQKEPNMAFRYSFEFQFFPKLRQTLGGYQGVECNPIDYRDFLCPLGVSSIHKADICFHQFDEQWERLKATYGAWAISQDYVNTPYLSGAATPKEEKGEHETRSEVLKIVNVADCYMRCNPFEGEEGDLGEECEIWLIIDVKNRKAIWYDYLGNHMKKRPFEVIVGVERVPDRWYGVGVFEMLDHKQLYIDTQFNRINFKSSKSSSVRFRVRNAVAQWKAGKKITFGDDQVYDIEDPRYSAENPPLFQVNLTEIDEYAVRLIELMIQAGANEVGIAGPDDGQMAGLDSTKLAAGIKSLERTGNTLMKRTEADQAVGISAVLEQVTNIILENMDDSELIWHPDSQALVQLNREEIRGIKSQVTLLLTRSRSTETVELGRMVVQLSREYYEALTPYERYKLRDEYVRQLKALEVQDADGLLEEVTKEQAEEWLANEANKPPPLEPKTSIASKIKVYPSERAQIIQREGITPASQEEMAAVDAQEAAAEVDKQKKIAVAKEDAKPAPPKPTAKK